MLDLSYWSECKICGMRLDEMPVSGRPSYRIDKFRKHILECHGLSAETYFEKYFSIVIPLCACGCGGKVPFKTRNKRSFEFCDVIKGHTDVSSNKWKEGMLRLSDKRKGRGNPMYGKEAWNAGLTKNDHPSLMSISEKLSDREVSDMTKVKQSESAKKRLVHGHTGCKHTPETIEFLRQNTLRMIHEGRFSQTRTKPHLAMCDILDGMGVEYEEEYEYGMFSWDFCLIDSGIFIEVDGDYFHSNPKFYPDGPQTATQKMNKYRDWKKTEFIQQEGIVVLHFWECDVLNNSCDVIEGIKVFL